MKRSSLRSLALASALAVCLGAFTESAAASTINTSARVRACTNLNDTSCNVLIATLAKGTTVTMRCWRDESKYAGTVRWFWIAGGGVEGFVSANHVSSQTTVGHCNGVRRIQAARWAGTKLGQNYLVGECLAFVRAAWSYAGVSIGSVPQGTTSTAYNYWKANPKKYTKYSGTNPRVGALVFWGPTSGFPEGHVAISIGAGRVISTYERSTKPVHIFRIADRNKTHPYLGYMRPG